MSKGLEIFKEIRTAPAFMGGNDRYRLYLGSDVLFTKDCDVVEKELMALEIIINKRVDIWNIMDLLEQDYEIYYAFCKSEKYADCYICNQDEFALLKEVLGNE